MKDEEDSAVHRHDLSDAAWARIEPLLPGRRGQWGGIARDNRRFVNAVLWTIRRFIQWRDAGVWERLLEAVVDEPDMEWLMVDATHVKAHRYAAGAAGGPRASALQGGGARKYIWPWIHLVFRSESLSLRVQSLTVRRLCR